jgi:hypothetical protein
MIEINEKRFPQLPLWRMKASSTNRRSMRALSMVSPALTILRDTM